MRRICILITGWRARQVWRRRWRAATAASARAAHQPPPSLPPSPLEPPAGQTTTLLSQTAKSARMAAWHQQAAGCPPAQHRTHANRLRRDARRLSGLYAHAHGMRSIGSQTVCCRIMSSSRLKPHARRPLSQAPTAAAHQRLVSRSSGALRPVSVGWSSRWKLCLATTFKSTCALWALYRARATSACCLHIYTQRASKGLLCGRH